MEKRELLHNLLDQMLDKAENVGQAVIVDGVVREDYTLRLDCKISDLPW